MTFRAIMHNSAQKQRFNAFAQFNISQKNKDKSNLMR